MGVVKLPAWPVARGIQSGGFEKSAKWASYIIQFVAAGAVSWGAHYLLPGSAPFVAGAFALSALGSSRDYCDFVSQDAFFAGNSSWSQYRSSPELGMLATIRNTIMFMPRTLGFVVAKPVQTVGEYFGLLNTSTMSCTNGRAQRRTRHLTDLYDTCQVFGLALTGLAGYYYLPGIWGSITGLFMTAAGAKKLTEQPSEDPITTEADAITMDGTVVEGEVAPVAENATQNEGKGDKGSWSSHFPPFSNLALAAGVVGVPAAGYGIHRLVKSRSGKNTADGKAPRSSNRSGTKPADNDFLAKNGKWICLGGVIVVAALLYFMSGGEEL